MFQIPERVMTYEEGFEPKPPYSPDEEVIYEPVKGERINVVMWDRYPSYDLIFGVPDKTSPKYELEVGYFALRDSRTGRYFGMYVDIAETEECILGFQKILEASRDNSKHLWQKREQG